ASVLASGKASSPPNVKPDVAAVSGENHCGTSRVVTLASACVYGPPACSVACTCVATSSPGWNRSPSTCACTLNDAGTKSVTRKRPAPRPARSSPTGQLTVMPYQPIAAVFGTCSWAFQPPKPDSFTCSRLNISLPCGSVTVTV